MQEGNDRRAFDAKRQSISLMEQQVTEAQRPVTPRKVADLQERLRVAREDLGAGRYGAAPDRRDQLFEDAKKAAGTCWMHRQPGHGGT